MNSIAALFTEDLSSARSRAGELCERSPTCCRSAITLLDDRKDAGAISLLDVICDSPSLYSKRATCRQFGACARMAAGIGPDWHSERRL
jgi:hypothetical protein